MGVMPVDENATTGPPSSAAEQARRVRAGEVSSTELVSAALEAIERTNPTLNAWVTLAAERALAEAADVRAGDPRPLAGVPIAVKDLTALTAGIRTTMGSAAFDEWVPPEDSATVRRLREAGAIVLGKTNTSELGVLALTEPERFGPTRNPWDPARSPGGSSGGSAAAVASGTVLLAHGSDGGGSVRIPAACCGVVGLKPTRGRVSPAPGPGDVLGLGTEGALVRRVEDAGLALDVIAGHEPGDPWIAPAPSGRFAAAAARDPGPLRVALTTRAPMRAWVDPVCASAVRAAGDLLADLGHDVREAAPDWEDPEAMRRFVAHWTAGVEPGLQGLGERAGTCFDPSRVEPLTRAIVEGSRQLTAADYQRNVAWLRTYARRVLASWRWDVLLTPTLATLPPMIGALQPAPDEDPRQVLWNVADVVPFTPPWNVTGQPALSLPLGTSHGGLPLGVQLVGAPAAEEVLLSLAGQLERASPWCDRWPAVRA
jgi:amidase